MNNMKIMHCIAFLAIGLLISCQGEKANTSNNKSNSQANKERLSSLKKEENPGNVGALRAQALSILNHRLKNNPESYAIIEAGIWEYQFVFDGKMSERGAYEGVWIDFKPDFTYDYGKYNQVNGSGRYNYHFERGELLMIDNDNSMKPQEWTVKNAGDAMVLVGTPTYKDNSIQMKLDRVDASMRSQSAPQ